MRKHLNKKHCTLSEEDKSVWIKIADNIECKDKQSLPTELKHVDKGTKGGMKFPSNIFLPFMRLADLTFKECASEQNQSKFGNNIAGIIKLQMKGHLPMKEEFASTEGHRMFQTHFWMEKLCNARINDTLLIATEKLELNDNKGITSKTQQLRDGLLTQHVQK